VSKRVALYLRVSSEEQDLAGQERDLREYSESRGWTVNARYAEKASATGKLERETHDKLCADAYLTDRAFDRVLVWSLDRWSREERFSKAVASIEALEELGVRFHSLREPMLDSSEDGSPSMGRDLLRAILPVIAAFESRRKSERVRVAMREIKEGRRETRSKRPVGRPARVTPELGTKVAELRAGGLPWKEIAHRTGLKAETCRRASWLLKRREQGVENRPASERVPLTPEEVPR
jgi:DNA invertase Pin-like site-specific DNA recombinase